MPFDSYHRSETNLDSASDDSDRIPPVRIVETIRAAPVPVVNTQYLAGECDVPTDELFEQLSAMVEDGTLEHHRVEGRWHLWWLSLESELEE
ncbi:hypothetical protein [Halomontanus rarus]|uniref:hypothetical protein n=1 Tax=Halomontanus rarus TaxID=3034020 RepID=UPI001F621793